MIGEEFAGFENMTLPVLHGGLGFTHMWNVRWTEAMMNYFSLAPGIPCLQSGPSGVQCHHRFWGGLYPAPLL